MALSNLNVKLRIRDCPG